MIQLNRLTMRMHRIVLVVGGIFLPVLATGCGGGGGYTAAPVSGVVTLNGAPLAGASIVFQPTATGNPGPPSSAETDTDGTFTLYFTDGKEGAVVGQHKVYITTRKMKPSPENSDIEVEIAAEQVPLKYRSEPPSFDVPRGGTDAAKFELAGVAPASGAAAAGGQANQAGGDGRVRND
jgi:hypothetical protein